MSKPRVIDLTELFELQKALDAVVMAKHPDAKDVLLKKYAALLVEIGELMNEWEMFKFWKVDPKPRVMILEEFVDCVHFAISIAIEHGHIDKLKYHVVRVDEGISLLEMFLELFADVRLLQHQPEDMIGDPVNWLIGDLFAVGYMLGFEFEEIVEVYKAKNAENHKRQASGY